MLHLIHACPLGSAEHVAVLVFLQCKCKFVRLVRRWPKKTREFGNFWRVYLLILNTWGIWYKFLYMARSKYFDAVQQPGNIMFFPLRSSNSWPNAGKFPLILTKKVSTAYLWRCFHSPSFIFTRAGIFGQIFKHVEICINDYVSVIFFGCI